MNRVPDDNTAYATVQYWNQRYSQEPDDARYDWFKDYSAIKLVLAPLLQHSDRILMLGCGNSSLSEDMYKDGYKNIVNIDFSEVVIENMRKKCGEEMPEMDWLVMDVLDMSQFPDASFDVAIDKGTMDALMCEKGDVWELDPKVAEVCHKMCSEVSRVVKPGGRYIQITFGQPHFRRKILTKPEYGWDLQVTTIGECFHYFVYSMTKRGNDNTDSASTAT